MAIAQVQVAHNSGNGVSSLAKAFGSNITTGNLIGVAFETRSAVSTVTDSGGRTWTQQISHAIGFTPGNMYMYTAPVGTGGACTVTVTTTGSAFLTMFIFELSGTDTSITPLSTSAAADQGNVGTNVPVGPTGTSGANEFAVGVGFVDGGAPSTITADAAWTSWDSENTNNLFGNIAYKVVNSATASSTWTLGGSNYAGGMIAVFKNASGGGTTYARGFSRAGSMTGSFVRHGAPFTRTAPRNGSMTLAFKRSGSTFRRTVARSGSMTSTFSRLGTFKRALTRAGSMTATMNRLLTAVRTLARSGSMTGTFSRVGSTFKRVLSRSGSMTGIFSRAGTTFKRAFSRAGSMMATMNRLKATVRALSRAGSMTATFSRLGTFRRTSSRAGSMSATMNRVGTFKRALSRVGSLVGAFVAAVIHPAPPAENPAIFFASYDPVIILAGSADQIIALPASSDRIRILEASL